MEEDQGKQKQGPQGQTGDITTSDGAEGQIENKETAQQGEKSQVMALFQL